MPARTKHLVVIGTSAGGLEALRALAGALPADFPAAICVVMHMAPESPGILHEILRRAGPLDALTVTQGDDLAPSRIYVAPPDCHLVIEPGRVRATKGPRENRFRPAIDPLFRSAAQVYGPAVIGVILTGNLDDGTAGLGAIKRLGGIAIVQDPQEALFPSMPQHALNHVKADHVVPLAQLPSLLVSLTAAPPEDMGEFVVPDHMNVEVNIAKEQNPIDAGLERVAQPSRFACPECHGVLLQMKEEGLTRFRCHTGHAYSIESLLADISHGIDEALWNTIRALEEGHLYMRQMADHLRAHNAEDAKRLDGRAQEAHAQSEILRGVAASREPLTSTKD
jgi:two-component system, chemotaxis family, protein-glutamate methylesterase/glutaminase